MLSSTLKDRLKKCGRYHPGTPTTVKLTPSPSSGSSDKKECNEKEPQSSSEASFITKSDYSQHCDTPKRKIDSFHENSKGLLYSEKLKKRKIFQPETTSAKIETDLSQDVSQKEAFTSEHEKCTISKVLDNSCEASCDLNNRSVENTEISVECELSRASTSQTSPYNYDRLLQIKSQLKHELEEKEEKLRKLKMVDMYRQKNNLTDLEVTINTWRDVTQRALADLLELLPEPRPNMTELLTHLQIDPELVKYDAEEDSFL